MPITTFERNASIAEMAVELDRRGAVIDRLEAELTTARNTAKVNLAGFNNMKARAEAAEARLSSVPEGMMTTEAEREVLHDWADSQPWDIATLVLLALSDITFLLAKVSRLERERDEALNETYNHKKALEVLRPIWAHGWTDDSIAAQASSAALGQLWAALKVTNQTDAIAKVRGVEEALEPFAKAVFNDNGDVTYDYTAFSSDDLWKAYSLLRRAAIRARKEAPDA